MNSHSLSYLFSSDICSKILADYSTPTWGWIGIISGILGILVAAYLIFYFIFCPIKRDTLLARKNYWIWVTLFLLCVSAATQLWGVIYTQLVSAQEPISKSWYMLIFLFGSSIDPDRMPEAGYTYMLLTWIKLFVFNGILVATMVGLFERRITHYRDGAIRYSKFVLWLLRNRYAVVIGSNEVAAVVIKNLLNSNTNESKASPDYHCEHKHKYIILQTTRRAQEVRQMLESHLDDKEIDRIIVYTASRDSQAELSKLHLQYASQIYILGEQTVIGETEAHHDTMNMRCLNLIGKLLLAYKNTLSSGKTYTRKICRVMFEYQTTHSVFQFSDVSENVKETLDFIPFNRYESWARKVLVNHCSEDHGQTIHYTPLDGYEGIHADSDKHVHMVIVGMSRMGIAMGVQTLFQAHYPNFVKNPSLRTRVTFIDSNADKEMSFFKGRYATLFELARTRYLDTTTGQNTGWVDPMMRTDNQWQHLSTEGKNFIDLEIEFVKGEIESEGVRRYLHDITLPALNSKLTIAICLTHTHQAIAASLYMPIEVYTCRQLQQILVYQREAGDVIYNISEKTKGNSVRYKKLRPFGMLYANYMDDMTLFWKAVLTNATYSTNELPIDIMNNTDPLVQQLLDEWHQLMECKKISNKLFADSMYQKIRCMMSLSPEEAIGGFHNKLLQNEHAIHTLEAEFKKNNTTLASCEHNRWNVEQLLMGFAPILEEDDKALQQLISEGKDSRELINQLKASSVKVHPNICDFDHLDKIDPGAKQYDENLNNAIPTILAAVDGYKMQ